MIGKKLKKKLAREKKNKIDGNQKNYDHIV
jgi:hypothetical protein